MNIDHKPYLTFCEQLKTERKQQQKVNKERWILALIAIGVIASFILFGCNN